MKTKAVSCGVLVTDGDRLLLGHATRSPRWDIPKGMADHGETFAAAARRELVEETGLDAPEAELRPLGVFDYLPAKDLALFAWTPPVMPDPSEAIERISFRTGSFRENPTLRTPKTPGEDFPDGDEPEPEAVYHIDDFSVSADPVHFVEKPKSDGTLASETQN